MGWGRDERGGEGGRGEGNRVEGIGGVRGGEGKMRGGGLWGD